MELLTLHLFSGAGGGILADALLGFRPIGAVECDNYCRRVLLNRQADGVDLWFCSPLCASRYAKRMGLDVDHIDRRLSKPYNGAYKGNSPFDMDDRECRPWRDYDPYDDTEDDDGDYDCCDDAEDYGEE